jgi:polysaccharide biosynthesis/export protein
VSKRSSVSLYMVLAASVGISAAASTLGAQGTGGSETKEDAAARAGKEAHAAAKDKNAKPGAGQVSAVQTPDGYRVGVEDELTISVWHEPELSQGVVVRPDGMITLPLLNDIKVTGLTTDELKTLLTEKLKPLVNDPQVTVTVRVIKSRKVSLVGNAAKQGVYPLGGRMTVMELLAQAGGLGPFAKAKSIYILRKVNGKEIRIPFNYKKALSGKGDDPELLPNDMVVVP